MERARSSCCLGENRAMSEQVPGAVKFLIHFLEADHGLYVSKNEEAEYFGDKLILLKGDAIQVRIIRDRANWATEISSRFRPGDCYDIPLLIEYIKKSVGPDVISFDAQAEFIRTRWKSIEDIFSRTDAAEANAGLCASAG